MEALMPQKQFILDQAINMNWTLPETKTNLLKEDFLRYTIFVPKSVEVRFLLQVTEMSY